MFALLCMILLSGLIRQASCQPAVGEALQAVPLTQSGVPNFNMMNCADFLRHMGSTVPSRLGMFGSQRKRSYLAPVNVYQFRYGAPPSLLDQRIVFEPMDSAVPWPGQFDPVRRNVTNRNVSRRFVYARFHHRRQLMNGLASMGGFFRDLLGQVSNFNNQNIANCQARPRLGTCEQIDGQAQAVLPQWFFDWQVMNNANHAATQLTQSPFHALFDAGYKAYKCMCQCA